MTLHPSSPEPSAAPTTLPGRLVFRIAAGAEYEHVQTHRAARLHLAAAAVSIDGWGPLDRTIRRHTPAMQVSRAFTARHNVNRPQQGHLDWDPLENELGLSRTFRLELDPEADVQALLSDLLDLEVIEMAAPQYVCQVPFNRPHQPSARALERAGGTDEDAARALVDATTALAMEPGDSALIIGLVDSGVVMQHPELSGRLRPGLNTVSADELSDGVELLSQPRGRSQDVGDDHGHGTECAGILCGNGFRMPRGLAGASRLLPIRALCGARLAHHDMPTAVGSLPDIDSGWKSAIDLGARVLNLSFGTPDTALGSSGFVPHAEIVRYALAHDCTLVVASGNSGDATRYFPAALPGVIAVGSCDAHSRPSRFTSRGAHVALSAPGEDLVCASVDGYKQASGTSFAAPLVAAACALMLARAARQSTAISPATLRAVLMRTATPFAGRAPDGCGSGILNVPAALRAIDDECRAPPQDAAQDPSESLAT